MLTGKLSNGFKYEVKENMVSDWDFIEALSDFYENENFSSFKKALIILMGQEQFERFKDACRDKDGAAPLKVVAAAFGELREQLQEQRKELKN